jgi:hypothetical protein
MRRILGPYSLSMNDDIGVLVSCKQQGLFQCPRRGWL